LLIFSFSEIKNKIIIKNNKNDRILDEIEMEDRFKQSMLNIHLELKVANSSSMKVVITSFLGINGNLFFFNLFILFYFILF
jgi:hypothetical protein